MNIAYMFLSFEWWVKYIKKGFWNSYHGKYWVGPVRVF